jgi:hypothetical protein
MPERSSNIMHQGDVSTDRSLPMLSRVLTRAAPPVVALSMISLIPTLVLLGRLGLLTDPMVWASFVLPLGFLAVGLMTTVRRVGNPIGWLLLWQGVVAGLSGFGAAYGMYDLQVAAEPLPGGSLLLWMSAWIWLAALAASPIIHVLFPNGRLLSRRWAGVIWLALASMALAMAAIAVVAWPLPGPTLLEGPSWGPELHPPPPLALLGLAMFGVAEAASLTAMAIRLRRATKPFTSKLTLWSGFDRVPACARTTAASSITRPWSSCASAQLARSSRAPIPRTSLRRWG